MATWSVPQYLKTYAISSPVGGTTFFNDLLNNREGIKTRHGCSPCSCCCCCDLGSYFLEAIVKDFVSMNLLYGHYLLDAHRHCLAPCRGHPGRHPLRPSNSARRQSAQATPRPPANVQRAVGGMGVLCTQRILVCIHIYIYI